MATISQTTCANTFSGVTLQLMSAIGECNGPFPALVQVVVWHRLGDQPSSEPMMAQFGTTLDYNSSPLDKIAAIQADDIFRCSFVNDAYILAPNGRHTHARLRFAHRRQPLRLFQPFLKQRYVKLYELTAFGTLKLTNIGGTTGKRVNGTLDFNGLTMTCYVIRIDHSLLAHNGWDRRMDRQTDRQADKGVYRAACCSQKVLEIVPHHFKCSIFKARNSCIVPAGSFLPLVVLSIGPHVFLTKLCKLPDPFMHVKSTGNSWRSRKAEPYECIHVTR